MCQLRVCSAQADGSGGEEQLQTVTVPLHKVRMQKEKRRVQIIDCRNKGYPTCQKIRD